MKVAITARNFDSNAVALLEQAGFFVDNYTDRFFGTGTTEAELASCIKDADAVIMGLEPCGQTLLHHCQNLKLLSKRSIGYDTVDLAACQDAHVSVMRTKGYVEGAVAEHVMAYLLLFSRNIVTENAAMHEGQWVRSLSYGAKNRTLGLIGFGGIGQEIAKRADGFGMKVIYYCRHPKKEWEEQYHVTYAPLEELLRTSDYISVNVNLSESTRHLIDRDALALMKKECVLINIARSAVVDTLALKEALEKGQIRGACVDVFDHEPCTDSPLASCPNALLTPHTAPFTSENFEAMNRCAAQNVIDFFCGTPKEMHRLL